MPDATRRVALITGANKGIGLETARQPGKTGIVVLLDARNLALGEKAAETIRLDLLPDDRPTGGYFEAAGANPWQAAYAEVGEEGTSVAEEGDEKVASVLEIVPQGLKPPLILWL
jgi:NAD(P)-dependent dehydrogenase (short-subunit alcohol dehydrogenase family)